MPYAAEIRRTNPTCFLFLVDQSSSMLEPFGGNAEKNKAQGVAIVRFIDIGTQVAATAR